MLQGGQPGGGVHHVGAGRGLGHGLGSDSQVQTLQHNRYYYSGITPSNIVCSIQLPLLLPLPPQCGEDVFKKGKFKETINIF